MSEPISVAVLAGGASRRMGTDKGLIEIAGRPMALWALDAVIAGLEGELSEVMFIANSEGYQEIAAVVSVAPTRVIGDLRPGLGPLAGIETALASATSPAALVIACDLPLLDPALIAELQSLAHSPNTVAAMAVTESGSEPCLAIYGKACLPAIEAMLDEGRLEARQVTGEIGAGLVAELRVTNPQQVAGLRNVNTPEELANARKIITGRRAHPRN